MAYGTEISPQQQLVLETQAVIDAALLKFMGSFMNLADVDISDVAKTRQQAEAHLASLDKPGEPFLGITLGGAMIDPPQNMPSRVTFPGKQLGVMLVETVHDLYREEAGKSPRHSGLTFNDSPFKHVLLSVVEPVTLRQDQWVLQLMPDAPPALAHLDDVDYAIRTRKKPTESTSVRQICGLMDSVVADFGDEAVRYLQSDAAAELATVLRIARPYAKLIDDSYQGREFIGVDVPWVRQGS